MGTITLDPTLGKLATGMLELEIKSEPPAQKQEKERDEEGFTASGTKDDAQDKDKLQGTWRVVTIQIDGAKSIGEGGREIKANRLLIDKSSFTFFYTLQSPLMEPEARKAVAEFTLDTKQTPKVIVLTWKESPNGKKEFTQKAVYSVEADTLKLSLSQDDQDNKVPTEFLTNASGKRVLTIFKRDPTSKDGPEGFTAWGKEVGGLQAGIGFRPGEKRAYSHGETVKLIVRVRNVGKEEVKFEYIKQFLDEKPPTVTNADGKRVPQGEGGVTGVWHGPVKVTLAPGKEIQLQSRIHGSSGRRYELRPASGGGKPTTEEWPLVVGTGKVSLQYERVFGNSSIGRIKLDPVLSKLATGRLELEIKSEPPVATEKSQSPPSTQPMGTLPDAIKAFNEKASKDPIGKNETPITEQEVIAGIRASQRPKDSAVTDELYDAFKKIAETRQLPPGATLQAIGGIHDPGGSFVYDVWWVRVKMPKEDGGTYSFEIRERIIRSRTLQEELVRIEKERPDLPTVDGGRLEGRVNDLKARIAKMKTK